MAHSVLIVDDDFAVRDSLAEIIRDTGRTVFEASDGAHALELLEGHQVPRPCLVLLDWLMESMRGDEFLERLQARAEFEHLPVVVMTAAPGPKSSLPGVRATLRKPFELDALFELLDSHC